VRLQRRFGHLLLFSLLLLLLLLGLAELLARSRYFKAHVMSIDIGSRHTQFELQRGRLEMVVADGGQIECIFLGNSMVWRGFNPAVFARNLRKQTGHGLRCFNFGVEGMPAASAAEVASVLVQEYEPRYLIYGTDARDYAIAPDAPEVVALQETRWLRYRLGDFSVSGWLYEHIHLLRYAETLEHLLRLQNPSLIERDAQHLNADNYGFNADRTVERHVHTSPLAHQDISSVREDLALLSDYTIHPEHVEGLAKIVALNSASTEVIVVGMPVPESSLQFFSQGTEAYERFLALVAETAQEAHVPFVWPRPDVAVPDNGWADYSHLNRTGARAFTHWLAHRMVSDETALIDWR
jgi:hypothetical protein